MFVVVVLRGQTANLHGVHREALNCGDISILASIWPDLSSPVNEKTHKYNTNF